MNEWTDIKGQEGRYQICTDGRIRCMPHYVRGKNGSYRRIPIKELDLKAEDIFAMKQMLLGGQHVIRIAEQFGVSRKVVSRIKSGRSYAWLNS